MSNASATDKFVDPFGSNIKKTHEEEIRVLNKIIPGFMFDFRELAEIFELEGHEP